MNPKFIPWQPKQLQETETTAAQYTKVWVRAVWGTLGWFMMGMAAEE